jgi:hypothetical protein
MYFGKLPWLGQSVLARFLGIINLNSWQIFIIGLSRVRAHTVSEDPIDVSGIMKQLILNSKIDFYLQVLIWNNVTDYLWKANNQNKPFRQVCQMAMCGATGPIFSKKIPHYICHRDSKPPLNLVWPHFHKGYGSLCSFLYILLMLRGSVLQLLLLHT